MDSSQQNDSGHPSSMLSPTSSVNDRKPGSRVLIQLPSPYQRRVFLLVLAYAKQLQKVGQQPTLAYCGVTGGACSANLVGNPLVCIACQKSTRESTSDTGLPLVKLNAPPSHATKSRLSHSERKEIAEGVQSTLISYLRVLKRDLNKIGIVRAIKRKHYETAATLLEAANTVIEEQGIEETVVPNGRFACRKSLIIASKSKGLPFTTLDFNILGRPMVFRGHTPHDRDAIQTRVLSNPTSAEVADRYYKARENANLNPFAAKHNQFAPPEQAGDHQRRISFFLSSQDECEALGPLWRSPFRDNANVIFQAATRYPETYFCVRFHPNQATIASDVFSGFEQLNGLSNVKIYGPEDDVNTYDMIRWSDVIITFASTVAAEACWRQKPVIQLGPSFTDKLGISETPQSIEEFLELLGTEIQPRGYDAACKYAHYSVKDFDELEYLEYNDGKLAAVGFRRKLAGVIVPLAQVNELSKRGLKKLIKYRLQSGRKAA
ncbi:Capsule polysaccharide biosynthesis protein [Rosistilla oblonga]|uniref:capsular polysaccharide export protein, LipB/KpsS family n=1 Tax=Rosistilla oblonga TaxID=2527990 RepID=UPI00118A7F0B|nr:hypothetical protein [Rosistilla oblonga]QDV11930.1 Capsule polysaccharide biosynthesis protein [Rosistilla oblonga]